jgi:hypothetical protein
MPTKFTSRLRAEVVKDYQNFDLVADIAVRYSMSERYVYYLAAKSQKNANPKAKRTHINEATIQEMKKEHQRLRSRASRLRWALKRMEPVTIQELPVTGVK